MTIQNSTIQDINEIFRLYRLATAFQRSKFLDNIWPEFNKGLVKKEIQEKRQFKITINDTIACVWAVTFSDSEIWGEKDKNPSLYIHRIATNPDYRGKNFVGTIVDWAKTYALANERKFVRLDTCGHNKNLIRHYTKNGFEFLGIISLGVEEKLPEHYHNADVCLFEIAVKG
ncbi:GNAT family N-acetyltransferase [Costertonia aggregata]|uniref:GNAT family N-acetyltransferase n=1 Tax=Costertonia aggregata TaxID=343403 RepID=A0A7H9ALK1_9FLAO|nr:GNAT family N-acetyltransferase [Costertonia aggregata]QLG44287.1 GNAT family N-acetyltransferase [Costertonia aggregata]